MRERLVPKTPNWVYVIFPTEGDSRSLTVIAPLMVVCTSYKHQNTNDPYAWFVRWWSQVEPTMWLFQYENCVYGTKFCSMFAKYIFYSAFGQYPCISMADSLPLSFTNRGPSPDGLTNNQFHVAVTGHNIGLSFLTRTKSVNSSGHDLNERKVIR